MATIAQLWHGLVSRVTHDPYWILFWALAVTAVTLFCARSGGWGLARRALILGLIAFLLFDQYHVRGYWFKPRDVLGHWSKCCGWLPTHELLIVILLVILIVDIAVR